MREKPNEFEFVTHPENWPLLRLPMKHRHRDWKEEHALGVIYPGETTVHLGNMFDMTPNKPVEVYDTIEALLKDWTVD